MPDALALMAVNSPTWASSQLAPTEPSLRATAELLPPNYDALERVGEGSTAVVWRAQAKAAGGAAGAVVALKVAKGLGPASEAIAREGALLARVARRWGPALIDAGPGYVATEWIGGDGL